MADGAGRAGLGTKSAVHALADIDIEMIEIALLGLFVHLDADGDAGDRAISLASQTTGANIQVDFENAAITERQRLLNRHRYFIGILDRHRPTPQVRKCDRHPFERRRYGVLDILYVTGNSTHNSSTTKSVV